MSYDTTVKVITNKGKPTKASVHCGGVDRGFTDENTGLLTFSVKTNESYSISAERFGEKAYGNVRGGQVVTLRLPG